jgi:hypothetical protein
MKKRLLATILVVACVASAPPKVLAVIWLLGLTFAAFWFLEQRNRQSNLWWPCVICAALLVGAGVFPFTGDIGTAWLGFNVFSFLALKPKFPAPTNITP